MRLKEAQKKAVKTQKSQQTGYKFQNYTEFMQDSGPLQDYELTMAANDEAVGLPPTYAALQKKCGDAITQCRAVNAEVRLLEEKIMALGDTFLENLNKAYKPSVKKFQIQHQAKRYKRSPYDYLSEDGEFPPRKVGIPPSAIVPQTAVRQPIIDTSVLGVLHTTRYDPGRYTSRSQQHFLPPSTPVIPQVPTHEPVVRSSSRPPRQPSVPQPSPVGKLPNSPRLISAGCECRTVVQRNASVSDTSVLGVMPTTRYRCFQRSSTEGQPQLSARPQSTVDHGVKSPQSTQGTHRSHPAHHIRQTIPVNITKRRGQPHTIPASLRRSGQPPTPKTSSPVPNVIKSLSSTTSTAFTTSSGQRMAYSGGFQSSSSALPMDSTARNHTPPSALPTASVQPARPRHAKLATLLECGPDEHDARLWRFESHGLYNPQNMCFRNAGLQGLIHTSIFARLFLQLGDVLNRDEFGHIAPLVHATIEFVRMFYHQVEDRRPEADSWVTRDLSTGFYLNPTKLSHALANALPRFFTSQPIAVHPDQVAAFQSEEDCGEFLVEYLSVLNVEFDMIRRSLSSPTWKPSAQELRREYDGYRFESTKETAVYRLFSTLISETPEFLLRLPITETVFDVKSGIQTFFRQLGGRCYFEQLPAVLVIRLGRWVFDRNLMETRKAFKPIHVDTVVDIPSELIAPYCSLSSSIQYKLVGVVHHHGRTAVTGHYTADMTHPGHDIDCYRAPVKDDVRPWLRMNDRTVSTVPRDDILSLRQPLTTSPPSDKTAYVLFYERI